jgi:hypothetical protein
MKDRRIARRMLRLPSPATVIAAIALIVATAGVATAGRSSAGSKPEAAAAATPFITGAHVLDHSLTPVDFSGSVKGATGPRGLQGIQGIQGPPGPFPATLPGGKTVVGTYDMEGVAAGANGLVTSQISYLYRAPSQTTAFVASGTTNPNCPGNSTTPTANPGFTCIYETNGYNVGGHGINFNRASGPALYAYSSGAGQFGSYGTWAATAPGSASSVPSVDHAPATRRLR